MCPRSQDNEMTLQRGTYRGHLKFTFKRREESAPWYHSVKAPLLNNLRSLSFQFIDGVHVRRGKLNGHISDNRISINNLRNI